MPAKPTTAAKRRPMTNRKEASIEIVVRRGALQRFDALKTRTQKLPVVVTWDRRTDDRREPDAPISARERRLAERRRKPPFTWDLADFVVIEPPRRQKASPAVARAVSARKRKKTPKKR